VSRAGQGRRGRPSVHGRTGEVPPVMFRISPQQWRALDAMARAAGCTANEMARRILLQKSQGPSALSGEASARAEASS